MDGQEQPIFDQLDFELAAPAKGSGRLTSEELAPVTPISWSTTQEWMAPRLCPKLKPSEMATLWLASWPSRSAL
jgi:hypothetical protein